MNDYDITKLENRISVLEKEVSELKKQLRANADSDEAAANLSTVTAYISEPLPKTPEANLPQENNVQCSDSTANRQDEIARRRQEAIQRRNDRRLSNRQQPSAVDNAPEGITAITNDTTKDSSTNTNTSTSANTNAAGSTMDSLTGQAPKAAPVKKTTSFEKTLGLKWMGIFAALLIFIAFLLFGATVYFALNNVAKSVIMLIISASFTALGLCKMTPDKKSNRIWHVLSGCGIGGIYITITLMNTAFHLINSLALLILLILWISATLFLSRRFSRMFAYICYIGILITTILCEANWNHSLVSLIFYLIFSLTLILTFKEREFRKNYFWSMQFPIAFFYFSFLYSNMPLQSALVWVTLLLIVLLHPYIFHFSTQTDDVIYGFFHIIPAILNFMILYLSFNNNYDLLLSVIQYKTLYTYAFALTLIAIFINTAYKFKGRSLCINIVFYIAAAILPFLPYGYIYETYIGLALFFIAAFVYGFIKNKLKYLVLGSIYLFMYYFFEIDGIENAITVPVTLLAVLGLLAMSLIQQRTWLKIYIILFMDLFFVNLCSKDYYNAGIIFILLALTCFLVNSKFFQSNSRTLFILAKLYTVFIYLSGLGFLSEYDSNLIINGYEFYDSATGYILVIALFVIALSLYTNSFIYWSKLIPYRAAASILAGTCQLFLLLTVTSRLEAAGYIVSLLLILLSIWFITYGFRKDLKAFRIYGLILSLICTFKLVFNDINYDSSIYYPIGLFACGSLCLLICWIYNQVEKKADSVTADTENSEQGE